MWWLAFKAGFAAFFNQHKGVRRSITAWAVFTLTWVLWRVFGDTPPNIPQGTADALQVVMALFTSILMYYFYRRGKGD